VRKRCEIPAALLRRTWTPEDLNFATTADLAALEGLVGQERAVSALEFGLGIRAPGYNIFVAGPAGTGKTSYSQRLVRLRAATEPVPQDWAYVHNFDHADEPIALAFPAGTGPIFAKEMEEVMGEARNAALRALSSKEYHGQREVLVHAVQSQVSQVMEELEIFAREKGFGLSESERGLVPVPLVKGQPMQEADFEALNADARREIKEQAQVVQSAIAAASRRSVEMERQLQAKLREFDVQTAHEAMSPVLARLKERYRDLPKVVDWLRRVELELTGAPMYEQPSRRAAEEAAVAEMQAMLARRRKQEADGRFRVNVIVHQGDRAGAPVIVETNPTYANLFGKAEIVSGADGAPESGVMHMKAGSIHRANGGYLILQAADVLRSSFAWEALKRALSTRMARIEVPDMENRMLPMELTRPQPIPLDLKVILIGSSHIYHALYAGDEGFRKQFKVKAEFDTAMEATERNIDGYARFVSAVCRRENLKHFTASAVAEVIECSHRSADDQTKVSARFNEVVEVIYEANQWAVQEGATLVDGHHVRKAIREKTGRAALPEIGMQEMIRRGTILVDVDGAVVGQVNGLTVMTVGDFSFGSPSRITARAYMGQKGILHIEREIAMSGQIHDKGVLTLSAFLGDRFAQTRPLAFSASIAFEQTYVPVDGDSASSTELYALLSALSGLPIDQGIAVTGSVNQRGEIQPIGGVNEKIEGFFRVCQILGLTGRQGVMIPRRNLTNLMLAEEIGEAVERGQFHIWAVSTIEEGIQVLTGVVAGERGADGRFTPGSVFERVDRRIEELARQLYAWGRNGHDE